MSDESSTALMDGQSYRQSPVDDIESFSWVTLYSIVRNSASPHSDQDHKLQDAFDKLGRDTALRKSHNVRTKKGYSELTRTLSASALLRAYEDVNYDLRGRWDNDVEALGDSLDGQAWELCCHAAAVSGLLAVLQILVDFKARNNKATQR